MILFNIQAAEHTDLLNNFGLKNFRDFICLEIPLRYNDTTFLRVHSDFFLHRLYQDPGVSSSRYFFTNHLTEFSSFYNRRSYKDFLKISEDLLRKSMEEYPDKILDDFKNI